MFGRILKNADIPQVVDEEPFDVADATQIIGQLTREGHRLTDNAQGVNIHLVDVATAVRTVLADGNVEEALVAGDAARVVDHAVAQLQPPDLLALARAHAGRRVVAVTHGGVLAVLYRIIHDIPIAHAHKVAISNASYNAVAFDGDAWRLEAWDDTAHLGAGTPFVES